MQVWLQENTWKVTICITIFDELLLTSIRAGLFNLRLLYNVYSSTSVRNTVDQCTSKLYISVRNTVHQCT